MTKDQIEIENIQNKIKAVVNSFAEIERDENGKHLRASIEPKKNEINNPQFKHLDTLARLFTTPQEDHVAVYYNGKKIMIASSQAKPKAAKETLEVLSKFAGVPSLENYKELVKLAIRNIYLWLEKDAKKSTLLEVSLKEAQLNVFKSFKSLIQDYYEKIIKNQEELTPERLEKMKTCAKELFQEIKSLESSESETRDFMWDYLIPFDDANIIANAIQTKELGEEIVTAIKNPNELADFIAGKEGMHPEMKIINKLCQIGFQPAEFSYLGSSKLVCMPCHFALGVINKTRFNEKLLVAGTHGSTYPNWIIPTNFSLVEQQEILEKIEGCRHKRLADWELSTADFGQWEALIRQTELPSPNKG
ncbi:nucleic acid/nucleotide deaminase domain-containing protein [endosymbiont GvMRE of Glomus versiforme]|uniref:nucleic acid/nucleotide deaminase domain-containing protein n=1 Tax=endosymbiont GvMRE of Glomus versiforme TaxID=2039283 RepID=UPI000EC1567F|nr:nucleic acid/nucleotide deaminase domain-containing protein [endosymbiont GvMRE of Glomus versiforme]RHZ36791.1 hypothetical protein GvMRE_I2g596 [endosymbiont GvMRE of Glomus versiforme]